MLTTLGIQYWPLPAMQLCNATDNFVYNPCNNTAKEHWRDWRRDKRDTVVLWACLHKTKQCSREVISLILAFNIYHKIVPVLTKYCWHNYRQPNHNCINTDVFQDRDKCILVIFSQKNSQEMVVCVCGGGSGHYKMCENTSWNVIRRAMEEKYHAYRQLRYVQLLAQNYTSLIHCPKSNQTVTSKNIPPLNNRSASSSNRRWSQYTLQMQT